jgi:hypothetical protein
MSLKSVRAVILAVLLGEATTLTNRVNKSVTSSTYLFSLREDIIGRQKSILITENRIAVGGT